MGRTLARPYDDPPDEVSRRLPCNLRNGSVVSRLSNERSTSSGDRARGHGTKSDATRERAILALLSEASIGAAANRCGVSERTLRRWMTDDEAFKSELAAARTAMFQAGMHRVQALTSEAIDTLVSLMGRTVPPTVRLGAARTVAELGIHQYDAETILKKLDDLERLTRKA